MDAGLQKIHIFSADGAYIAAAAPRGERGKFEIVAGLLRPLGAPVPVSTKNQGPQKAFPLEAQQRIYRYRQDKYQRP